MSAPVAAERSPALIAAVHVMRDAEVDALPVVADGRLVGIVTDRDIVVRAVAADIDLHAACVGDVARRPSSTCARSNRSNTPCW